MNNEDKMHINSFKFYDRDELEELTKQYYLENKQLKEQLQQKENVMNKAKEYIKLKLNTKNKDGFPFLLFKRTHIEKILEVLDNKGEDKNE